MGDEYNVEQYTCPNCGTGFEVRQPKNHSEYTPCGACQNCGNVYAVLDYMKGSTELHQMKTAFLKMISNE